MKQLRVIRRLKETQPVELAATFMGAHALPEEYRGRREAYIRLLCQEMIPRAAREGLAEFCDVFCETGVFTAEESGPFWRPDCATGCGLRSTPTRSTPSAARSWREKWARSVRSI